MSMAFEEHDYIGLSELQPPMEKKGLNLKATELRLGLPGSESPERDGCGGNNNNGLGEDKNGFSLSVVKGLLVSGAKRVFSDTIDGGSGKWVFSGSEVDLAKNGGGGGGGSFSPRGFNGGGGSESNKSGGGGGTNHQQSLMASSNAVKEALPQSPKPAPEKKPLGNAPAAKAQVVGWPPIRSFRKNSMASNVQKNEDDSDTKLGSGCLYVKVSMDGAPYLRKVDLKNYSSYMDLSSALEKMFSCFTIGQYGSHGIPSRDGLSESGLKDLLHGSEYVLTYEDKDGDWMLVGDVPWEMFTDSCKRLRIMKSSDAIGLAPKSMEKSKNRI